MRMMGRAAAGTACCAPTGYCYGKARPGVESGSKLPHSTESWRRLIWRLAIGKSKEPAGRRRYEKRDVAFGGILVRQNAPGWSDTSGHI
jgi:hypothetical protein